LEEEITNNKLQFTKHKTPINKYPVPNTEYRMIGKPAHRASPIGYDPTRRPGRRANGQTGLPA